MTQAVADKATVPIHYTARLAKLRLNLTDEERAELDALAEELTEGDDAAIERGKSNLTASRRWSGARTASPRSRPTSSSISSAVARRWPAARA